MSAPNMPWSFEKDHALTKVKKPADAPKVPHFAIFLYYTSSHSEPGYDRNEPSYSVTDEFVDHYVTTDEAKWKSAIAALYEKDMNRRDVLAYAVSAVPNIKPQVVVSIG